MKKTIAILVSITVMLSLLVGCSQEQQPESNQSKGDKKINIVTTIFPEYDWVTEILGEKAEDFDITMLIDNGVDLHSFQPTMEDIIKISDCDVFIHTGGVSDAWVNDALKNATNKDMKVINIIDVLGDEVKSEEMVEGMEEHDHEHDEDCEHEEHEIDEHIWLSIESAEDICQVIATTLFEVDSANQDVYKANLESYIEKLETLDEEYKQVVETAKHNTLLFGDRFPFRYLVDDYDIDYYAAFSGCSAETEASFETVTFLAKKMDELALNSIITIEGTTHKIAQTIVENTSKKNQKVLVLNSMQSTSLEDVKNGVNYISIMQDNLEVLKQALN